MDTQQERLLQLDRDLKSGKNICSSGGVLSCFPSSLKEPFLMQGLGLIVCRQGSFQFSLDNKCASAKAGETLFIHEESWVQVLQETEDVEILILAYQIDRYVTLSATPWFHVYVFETYSGTLLCMEYGEEDEIMKYMSLIDSVLEMEESVFSLYEQKLLLLALTYRICSVYNRKLISAGQETGGRKNEIFVRLIQLIEQYYMQERSVEFYADKLCLSPKYLSALSKSICGYTVQELVFKAIIRKCISLLKNTQKNIQEISNEFGFPNASYFGTFFKKQMGMSPQQYRRNL